MRDYAEAGKHVGLRRKDVRLVSITGAENPGGPTERCTARPGLATILTTSKR
jgi:hypothetical protein